jgi:hypothetical protein
MQYLIAKTWTCFEGGIEFLFFESKKNAVLDPGNGGVATASSAPPPR